MFIGCLAIVPQKAATEVSIKLEAIYFPDPIWHMHLIRLAKTRCYQPETMQHVELCLEVMDEYRNIG